MFLDLRFGDTKTKMLTGLPPVGSERDFSSMKVDNTVAID